MKIIIKVILSVMVFIFMGCSDKNKSPEQTTVSTPKIDIHSAVANNDLDDIRMYIKAGSDIDELEPSRHSTPLITAAALGRIEAAKLLIDAGADLNYKNVDGSTALITASVFGRSDIAKLLINNSAKINIQNNDGATALFAAAFMCKKNIVKLLLEKGADKSIKDNSGKTVYEIMIEPFKNVKIAYDSIATGIKPLGIKLDLDKIRTDRPKIAKMLK